MPSTIFYIGDDDEEISEHNDESHLRSISDEAHVKLQQQVIITYKLVKVFNRPYKF